MFFDAYLSIDRRLLGIFRIYFGLVLFGDLFYHGSKASLFYSNDGILSNHRVLFSPQALHQFSLLNAFSSPGAAQLAFVLIAVVYAFYLVGYKTRWAQLLALISVASIDARNLFAEDGGCITINLVATWTLFLPLGDRFSLDALERKAQRRVLGLVGEDERDAVHTVQSLAVLAILLQAATIYFFNAVHKNGPAWMTGNAIHQVLWQNRCNTPLAGWLRYHEPSWLSPVLTWSTLLIEINLPVLILMPIARRVCRSAAFVMAVLLHGSIAFVMTLGVFSYVMIALMMLVIPHEVIAIIATRLSSTKLAASVERWTLRAVDLWSRIDQRGLLERFTTPPSLESRAFFGAMREGFLALLIVASGYQVLRLNDAVPVWMRPPAIDPFERMTGYIRLSQGWRMFAPDTPSIDGIMIIDAVTADGRHLDPFTGKPPDFDILFHGPFDYPILVADYLFVLGSADNAWARDELGRYILSWQQTTRRPARDRVVHFDAYLMVSEAPAPGSTQITVLRKELLFSGP
ncbi:MAG: lipase maturation factor family protein [Polyangiaceae bacterium]